MDMLGQFSLKGKVALVTGASHGIGFSMAVALAGAGAEIAFNGHSPDRLKAAEAEYAARGIHARGVDISGEAVRAINACAADYGLPVSAACADLLCEGAIPAEYFDLALLLKTLPLIERQRRGAARDVMARVNARFLIASFPTRTLGGRNVGMEAHYSAWMAENLPANRRVAARFADENELFYLLAEA